jgi:effector-binding domain-containing protein
MSINFQHLREIESELETYTIQNAKLSKTKAIRIIYNKIEKSINDGLTIHLLCDFLKQKGLDIAPNYLYLILHRIRKEKGLVKNKGRDYLIENNTIINNSDIVIATVPTHNNITSLQEKEKRYHEIKHAISVATTWREKYIAMGGDHEKIKDMAESQILHMYTALQKKFVKEYKPFIKSN